MSDAFGDEFELYDLRVEVLETGKPFVSHARVGDTFDVIGGRIVFPQGREASFSLYAMMAVLPFLPAKQRPTKDRLDALMRAKSGNVNEVAKELGFEPRSVYRWLAEEGLDAASYRPKPPP